MAMLRQGDLEITVNGQPHTVQAAAETPLLYVLRNELKLNAAKFGCGLSQCGTCTAHVDGEAICSCIYP
jgi:nicotinate dehydrogenase subunit A